ncbi:DUF6940 family protein [Plesiocystis pacifica]|nr:hypothetical protein [Plesiocystis pacifica]
MSGAAWREVVEGWAKDAAQREACLARLGGREAPAFLWETSASQTGAERFEERIIPAPGLARAPADSSAFVAHLGAGVVAFDNLRGDSRLVAPPDEGRDYGHLGAFLDHAGGRLQHALLRYLALEILAWWADPDRGALWVSTHGMAVPWLHLRLDPRPKYYRSELRRAPSG